MSGVAMPKWKSYTMPSWERSHIFRDPPKAIHTRKKERVDFSDVAWMVRNDDSRINEGVNYLARGTNPMVDVSYNNSGGGSRTNHLKNIQASNPYKVMREGAFRPPLFTQKDLLPWSRQRRNETAVASNPGIRDGFVAPNFMETVDRTPIHSAIDGESINYITVNPTATYRIQLPQEVFSRDAIIPEPLRYSASSQFRGSVNDDVNRQLASESIPHEITDNELLHSLNVTVNNPLGETPRYEIDPNGYLKDNIILKNISPNFSIVLYDPGTRMSMEVQANLKEKLNIAVQSALNRPIDLTRADGTQIKLKDYRWQIVNSTLGRDNLVLQLQNVPEIQLDRNIPIYAMGSNTSGYTKQERLHTIDPITADRTNIDVQSAPSLGYGRKEALHDREHNIQLRGMGSAGGIEGFGSVPTMFQHDIPTLNNRNMDVKQIAAQSYMDRFANY
jgi:hypothetical protein